jgi:DNA polymerase III sliding clamp (beta) subunit (PCNA family)
MSLTLSGFNTPPTKKKETKPDISTFISTDESTKNKGFLQVDHNSELNYSSACDGFRLALTGDIDNFEYQSFDEKINPVLKLAKSVLPSLNELNSHTITFNTNDLLEAMKLFAKNMKHKETYQRKIETGKKKGQFETKTREILRPVIMRVYTDDYKVSFNLDNTDMRAILDVDINLKYANMKINMGLNPKYLMDAVKLFKNRKHDSITIRLMDKENYNVSPVCMYDKDIYVMLLPVRVKTDKQEE